MAQAPGKLRPAERGGCDDEGVGFLGGEVVGGPQPGSGLFGPVDDGEDGAVGGVPGVGERRGVVAGGVVAAVTDGDAVQARVAVVGEQAQQAASSWAVCGVGMGRSP
ncbi:hypothetical protein AMK22_31980 [Streptomyces sp. CB01580]|nr:hypothetical protein AMK22_31980 [Streptomyces sp. CB01580]